MTSETLPDQIRRLVNEPYAARSLHQPQRIDAIFTDDGIYDMASLLRQLDVVP